jgi:hypothetical protein
MGRKAKKQQANMETAITHHVMLECGVSGQYAVMQQKLFFAIHILNIPNISNKNRISLILFPRYGAELLPRKKK